MLTLRGIHIVNNLVLQFDNWYYCKDIDDQCRQK